MGPHTVQIDVWSDYVCPFCYLLEPTLAQIQQDAKGKVRISWQAFELRPDPVPTLDPNGNYLRDVWERAVYPMHPSARVFWVTHPSKHMNTALKKQKPY